MYKITISGLAKTDYQNLKDLDGINSHDTFSEYFHQSSYKDCVTGGYMSFKYELDKLWTITEYLSTRDLNTRELKELADYTQGQWSDGIGEGFEQYPVMQDEDGNEVYISPWCFGQELSITQKTLDEL
jgi:hypothetical protein